MMRILLVVPFPKKPHNAFIACCQYFVAVFFLILGFCIVELTSLDRIYDVDPSHLGFSHTCVPMAVNRPGGERRLHSIESILACFTLIDVDRGQFSIFHYDFWR